MSNIRTAAKAIIIEDKKLLLIKNKDNLGTWFGLPGGGQRNGESLPEALKRECREEIGVDIEVYELLFIRDYIAANHEFARHHQGFHQLELMFRCSLKTNSKPKPGDSPDDMQVGLSWILITDLSNERFYPKTLQKFIPDIGKVKLPIYLGDVN